MPANPPHYPFKDDPFEWHPYSTLFDMMPADELKDLADDIEAKGILSPVQLYDGKILDGRNRYAALEIVNHRLLVQGKPPMELRYGIFEDKVNPVNDAKALDYVRSHNLLRRNQALSVSQRAALAVKFEKQYAEIAKREEQWRKEQQNSPTVVNSQPKPESPLERKSAYKAGRDYGAGQQSVSRAKAVEQADPELFQSLLDGEISVNAAYNQIKPIKPKKEPEPEIEPELTPQNIEVSNDDIIVAFSSNLGFLSPDEVQFCLNKIYDIRKSDLMDFLAKLKITDPLLFN